MQECKSGSSNSGGKLSLSTFGTASRAHAYTLKIERAPGSPRVLDVAVAVADDVRPRQRRPSSFRRPAWARRGKRPLVPDGDDAGASGCSLHPRSLGPITRDHIYICVYIYTNAFDLERLCPGNAPMDVYARDLALVFSFLLFAVFAPINSREPMHGSIVPAYRA